MREGFRFGAIALPEFGLFGICFGFLLAGLLANLPAPAFAGEQLIVNLASTAARKVRRARESGSASRSQIQQQWTANEFAFERAIATYEELIDEIVRELK